MTQVSYVGTLAQPGSTGNQAYTGVGFQPKAILFFGNQLTADGTSPGLDIFIGMAVSSSLRAVVANHAVDGGASSNTDRRQDNTKCCCIIDSSGTVLADADLVSMDSDGFTLNWTTVDATARKVSYLALGGSTLTNAYIKEIQSPTSTGNQAYTGVGFQPDCMITLTSSLNTSPPASATVAALTLGFGTSSSARASLGTVIQDASTNVNAAARNITDAKVISQPANSSGFRIVADIVSMDSDGFTLNWTTVAATAQYCWVLCLKGGSYFVGNFTTRNTGTGTKSTTGVGFQPGAILVAGSNATSLGSTINTESNSFVAAASGPSNQAVAAWDFVANSIFADSALETDNLIERISAGTPNINVTAALQSMDSDGFTLNYSVGDSALNENIFLAFKDVSSNPVDLGTATMAGAGGMSATISTAFNLSAATMPATTTTNFVLSVNKSLQATMAGTTTFTATMLSTFEAVVMMAATGALSAGMNVAKSMVATLPGAGGLSASIRRRSPYSFETLYMQGTNEEEERTIEPAP